MESFSKCRLQMRQRKREQKRIHISATLDSLKSSQPDESRKKKKECRGEKLGFAVHTP